MYDMKRCSMKQILVIDDRSSLRDNLVEILSLEDYDVIEAEDGLQGVQLARLHRPDLILCDVMMPGLDGFGVLRELHGDPTTATIPVIFLSAKVDAATVQQGLELGARCYVTKPFELPDLLAVIRAQLPD
jgi:DNA-binding response OmpR family regulator